MGLVVLLPLAWFVLFQGDAHGGWLTLDRVIFIVALLSSGAGNLFQYRNRRADVIHETDLKQITSLEGALKRAETDRDTNLKRAEEAEAALVAVKRELVTQMALDVKTAHDFVREVLDVAATRRRVNALEQEAEKLNAELVAAQTKARTKELKGGET